MKWTEIQLDRPQEIAFPNGMFATTEYAGYRIDRDTMRLHFWNDSRVTLTSLVDVSAQIDGPRVFAIAGRRNDALLLTGGITGYILDSAGAIVGEIALRRNLEDTQYWKSLLVDQEDLLLMVYESGVIAIDAMFNIRWHKSKYFNDFYIGTDGGTLVLGRDANVPPGWTGTLEQLLQRPDNWIKIRISDGALLTEMKTVSADDIRSP